MLPYVICPSVQTFFYIEPDSNFRLNRLFYIGGLTSKFQLNRFLVARNYCYGILKGNLGTTFFAPGITRGGTLGFYGIAVLSFLSSVISVILILICGLAISSSPEVCGFSSFWMTVFGKRSLSRYCGAVHLHSSV